MSEAVITIDTYGRQIITCGEWKLRCDKNILYLGKLERVVCYGAWLEDLFALLQVWKEAQAIDQTYVRKITELVLGEG